MARNNRYCLNFKTDLIFKTILLYMFIYEIVPIGFPNFLSTRKVSLLIVAVIVFFRHSNRSNSDNLKTFSLLKKEFSGLLFIEIYAVILALFNNVSDSIIAIPVMYMMLYIPIGGFLFSKLFDDINNFMNSIIAVNLFSAFIVFFQQTSLPFREFLYNHFSSDDNISLLRKDRAAIPGASGAMLTVWMLLGMICCMYFITSNLNRKTLYYLFYGIFMIASVLSGKTGTLLGLCLIAYIIFLDVIKVKLKKLILSGICITILYNYGLSWLKDHFTESRLERISSGLTVFFQANAQDDSLISLQSMEIPPITINTIIGTGLRRGYFNQNVFCYHDSGYIQSYFGFGLIVAFFFYLLIYSYLLKMLKVINDPPLKRCLQFLLVVIIIIEYKEPFCMYYVLLFSFSTIAILHEKQNNTPIERLNK